MEQSTDAQEAFTSVLDINASEVYIDQAAIPTTGLPYSGSTQNGEYVLSGSADLLRYYHQDITLQLPLHLKLYKQVNRGALFHQNTQILLYQMQIQKMQHRVIM